MYIYICMYIIYMREEGGRTREENSGKRECERQDEGSVKSIRGTLVKVCVYTRAPRAQGNSYTSGSQPLCSFRKNKRVERCV